MWKLTTFAKDETSFLIISIHWSTGYVAKQILFDKKLENDFVSKDCHLLFPISIISYMLYDMQIEGKFSVKEFSEKKMKMSVWSLSNFPLNFCTRSSLAECCKYCLHLQSSGDVLYNYFALKTYSYANNYTLHIILLLLFLSNFSLLFFCYHTWFGNNCKFQTNI